MYVFVYGTLRKGHGNHRLLEGAKFIGEFTSKPEFTMYHLGGFPAIVHSGSTPITGEIYQINEEDLKNLDRLEGHPTFYKRMIIHTFVGDTWVYVMNPTRDLTTYPVIQSGDWND